MNADNPKDGMGVFVLSITVIAGTKHGKGLCLYLRSSAFIGGFKALGRTKC